MKNIFRIFAVGLLGIFAASCEEQENLVYEGPEFVQFATSSFAGTETDGAAAPFVTTVLVGADRNDSGVTVNFTVSSSDPTRYTVSPAGGTLEIPAGEFSGEILITPENNLEVDGDLEITITLETSSSLPVGIGGEGLSRSTKTVTIIDDDCPIDIDAFIGTFSVFENFTDGVNSPLGLSDFFGESYQLELAAAPGDATGTKVVINNTPGFNVYIDDGTIMSFNACPGTVSFDAGFPVVALFAQFVYDASSYDEEDGVIQCTGPLATFGPYQFTFTRIDP